MKAEEYASGTCNRVLVLLRYGFTLALRWKVPGVVSNPVKEIKNIKDDNKIERYLTEVQTKALLDAVRQSESEMLQYIVLFLIYTGARKREVLDARWRDIDWAQLVRSARTAGPCRHQNHQPLRALKPRAFGGCCRSSATNQHRATHKIGRPSAVATRCFISLVVLVGSNNHGSWCTRNLTIIDHKGGNINTRQIGQEGGRGSSG